MRIQKFFRRKSSVAIDPIQFGEFSLVPESQNVDFFVAGKENVVAERAQDVFAFFAVSAERVSVRNGDHAAFFEQVLFEQEGVRFQSVFILFVAFARSFSDPEPRFVGVHFIAVASDLENAASRERSDLFPRQMRIFRVILFVRRGILGKTTDHVQNGGKSVLFQNVSRIKKVVVMPVVKGQEDGFFGKRPFPFQKAFDLFDRDALVSASFELDKVFFQSFGRKDVDVVLTLQNGMIHQNRKISFLRRGFCFRENRGKSAKKKTNEEDRKDFFHTVIVRKNPSGYAEKPFSYFKKNGKNKLSFALRARAML